MCIILTTTYVRCWGEYTHTLLCSPQFERSPLKYDRRKDLSISALNCHDLGHAHLHLDHSVPGTIEVKCERLWGGKFWDVLAPGEQVNWYNRQWVNCTNLVVLQKGGDRQLTFKQQKIVRERSWFEGEWTGKGQRVDWWDTDWVAITKTGKYQRMEKQKTPTVEMKTEFGFPSTADNCDVMGTGADHTRNKTNELLADHKCWLGEECRMTDSLTTDLTTTTRYHKRSESSSRLNALELPIPNSEDQIAPSMTLEHSKDSNLMNCIATGVEPPRVTGQLGSSCDNCREQIKGHMAEGAGSMRNGVAHSVTPMNAK
ncbi:hypothetical protein ACMFMF_007095 [Clarireedia jacksonii]